MPVSLASVRRNAAPKPPRILIYGPHGVGKTSMAASAPNPIFIQTEDGLGQIDAPSFGVLKTFEEILEAIGSLYEEEHDYQTVAIDSVDWMEPLVWAFVCQQNGWTNIEQPGFGKGYVAALDAWRMLFDGLNALRDEKGMTVILIAHADVKRFDSPETEPYDRYQIKLHARASALVQEHVDCVFFANYRVSTVKTDAGFNKKVVRGVGGGERLIYTGERPAFLAKNRYSMPDSLPMEWVAVAEWMPFFGGSTGTDAPTRAPEDVSSNLETSEQDA
jgi:hypothetical protein